MNLLHDGAHASTDWLRTRLDALAPHPMDVRLLSDGTLLLQSVRIAPRRRMGESIGVYRAGVTNRELHDDLKHLRMEMGVFG